MPWDGIKLRCHALAVALGLHALLLAGLHVLPNTLQATPGATHALAAQPPTTVLVLIAPVPAVQRVETLRAKKTQAGQRSGASPSVHSTDNTGPTAPIGRADAFSSPSPKVATAADTTNETTPQALRMDSTTLRQAGKDAHYNTVARLAEQAGQAELFVTTRLDPLAVMAAEASERHCPPAGQMREGGAMPHAAPLPNRSGDCERDRKARVRARALGH